MNVPQLISYIQCSVIIMVHFGNAHFDFGKSETNYN